MIERAIWMGKNFKSGGNMALIQCKECGKEISDQAAACPACGAPLALPKKPNALEENKKPLDGKQANWLLVLALIIGVVWAYSAHQDDLKKDMAGPVMASMQVPGILSATKVTSNPALPDSVPPPEPPLTKAEATAALSEYVGGKQGKLFVQSVLLSTNMSKMRQDMEWRNLDKFVQDAEALKQAAFKGQMEVSSINAPDNLTDKDREQFDKIEEATDDLCAAIVGLSVDVSLYAHTGMFDAQETAKDMRAVQAARKAFEIAAFAAYKHFGVPANHIQRETMMIKEAAK